MTAESPTIFVYDTETNKLPLWGKRSSHPLQPHMVQIAAALFDAETRLPLASLNLIIRPDGWDIEEGTIDVHGITPEHAERAGIPEPVALAAFFSLWEQATIRVAHGEPFDARIIRIALSRFGNDEYKEKWATGESFCTLKASRPICEIYDTKNNRKNKPPTLGEAYEFFTGQPLADAHKAHGDVRGCATVYWALQEYQTGEE